MLIFVAAYGKPNLILFLPIPTQHRSLTNFPKTGTWSIFGSLFICTPIHYFWDQTGNAKCMNVEAKWFSDAAVHIVSDIILLSIPMPFLKGLNLPYRQKAGLIAVFALGGLWVNPSLIPVPEK
jgi:hypothetical protein